MAQMIYREWFVNFRFAGHEKVKMVESEMGPIPQGWRALRLSSLVETQYGYVRPAAEQLGIRLGGWHDFRHTLSTTMRRNGVQK
jgi:integrase